MKHLQLRPEDHQALKKFIRSGTKNTREINRAYILLWLKKGKKIAGIEDFIELERTPIWRTTKNDFEEGLDNAIKDNPGSGQLISYE
ncbi:MAG: hypothetical protein R6V27_02735 [Balneolaceae bacterium]